MRTHSSGKPSVSPLICKLPWVLVYKPTQLLHFSQLVVLKPLVSSSYRCYFVVTMAAVLEHHSYYSKMSYTDDDDWVRVCVCTCVWYVWCVCVL